jgi:uncharacterized membrane protein
MRKIELIIGQVMRMGLLISVAMVMVGGGLYLAQNGHVIVHYEVFQSSVPRPSLTHFVHEIAAFSPAGIILLGLFILVLTQIIRVVLTAWLFIREKDYIFTGISFFILAVMIYSIFWRA